VVGRDPVPSRALRPFSNSSREEANTMFVRDIQPVAPAGVLLPALTLLILTAYASSPERTECPDGSHVLGSECHLAPDGTYFGDGAEIPEDVADDVADRIDEEADEQSGLYEEEVVEVEIDIGRE
jgi:hypothetical protein